MQIMLQNETGRRLPAGLRPFLQAALKTALLHVTGKTCFAVTVTIGEDGLLARLNREYRGIDKTTDVLSFPLSEFPPGTTEFRRPECRVSPRTYLLGDLVLSLPRAQEQAALYGHSPQREIAYLCVHGLLHLLGYDHETLAEKRRMRACEEEIMGRLNLQRTED